MIAVGPIGEGCEIAASHFQFRFKFVDPRDKILVRHLEF